MDILAALVKKRKLAKICRIGAGIIAIVGAIHVVSQAYTFWQSYRQLPSDVSFSAQFSPAPVIFLNYLPSLLGNLALYLFYCIVLYCASVVFDALSAPAAQSKTENEGENEKPELDDEGIVYSALKPEEIRQGKKLNHR